MLKKNCTRLYGSYEALDGGFSMAAMGDFTGGVSEMYDLNDAVPSNLFTTMQNSIQRKALMCCSISKLKSVRYSTLYKIK